MVGLVQNAEWGKLTIYCESDVINTWLLYLRWQRLTGKMPLEVAKKWEVATHVYLQNLKSDENVLRHDKFLHGWEYTHESDTKNKS